MGGGAQTWLVGEVALGVGKLMMILERAWGGRPGPVSEVSVGFIWRYIYTTLYIYIYVYLVGPRNWIEIFSF